MHTALQKPNVFAISLNITVIVSRRGFSVSITSSVSRLGSPMKLTVRMGFSVQGKRNYIMVNDKN